MAVRTDLIAEALRIIGPSLKISGDPAKLARLEEIADELEADADARTRRRTRTGAEMTPSGEPSYGVTG